MKTEVDVYVRSVGLGQRQSKFLASTGADGTVPCAIVQLSDAAEIFGLTMTCPTDAAPRFGSRFRVVIEQDVDAAAAYVPERVEVFEDTADGVGEYADAMQAPRLETLDVHDDRD